MNTMQKLRLTFHMRLNKKRNTMPKKKTELWERDLSWQKKFKINATIKWRRFDTQTRGMGFVFVLILGMMVVINVIPFIFMQYIRTLENQPYKDALNTACIDKDFYNWNFKSCESIGVRP